jgi:hypothetical protein
MEANVLNFKRSRKTVKDRPPAWCLEEGVSLPYETKCYTGPLIWKEDKVLWWALLNMAMKNFVL